VLTLKKNKPKLLGAPYIYDISRLRVKTLVSREGYRVVITSKTGVHGTGYGGELRRKDKYNSSSEM